MDFLTVTGAVDHNLLKLSDVSIDFIATNVGMKVTDPKWKHLNPDRWIVRDEFMQLFVRLSASKYLKTKKYLTYNDAVRQLFKDGILDFMKEFDSSDFRLNVLYTEYCDMVFKYYLKAVKNLYFHYSGKHSKPNESRFMCNDEFMKLFYDSGVVSDLFGTKELGIIFNLSMMTQVNESTSDRHCKMSFDEFIEAMARVAEKCNLLIVDQMSKSQTSYFGINLDDAFNKQTTTIAFKDQSSLITEDNPKSLFAPANIMDIKMKKDLEDHSEQVSNSDIDDGK